jgi:NADPH-dependent curcumin reductase CurA
MVIAKRARLMGLVVYDFYPRWDEFLAEVTPWVTEGRLSIEEDVAVGIDSLPAHFARLMNGENTGKALVRFGEAHL